MSCFNCKHFSEFKQPREFDGYARATLVLARKPVMNMNKNAPCFKCEIRYPGCHAICMKYEAWALIRKKQLQVARKEKEADEVSIISCRRQVDRIRKKRRR